MFQRLYRFSRNVYEPKLHILFAAFWSLSLMGVYLKVANAQVPWDSKGSALVVSFTVFLILFFLRAIDEIKDYDYDAQFKPDRPLVTGDVSFVDVWKLAGILFVLTSFLAYLVDDSLSLFVVLNMGYGLWLMAWERLSKTVADNILVNLLVTFPVSSALNFYVMLFVLLVSDVVFSVDMLIVAIGYICAFLHFDFGRKSVWPEQLTEGEQLYSRALGGWGHVVVTSVLGITACALLVSALPSTVAVSLKMLYLLPLAISLFGSIKFVSHRNKRTSLRPIYMGFLVSFYIVNAIVAFT